MPKKNRKLLAKYVIYGEPASKKNSKQITFMGGRPKLIGSARYRKWAAAAKMQISVQLKIKPIETISRRVRMQMVFYKAFDNSPDLSNLYEGPQDIIEEFGILENDTLVHSHDGSRKYFMCPVCPDRDIYKRDCKSGKKGEFKPSCGKKKQCPYNRVEIEIYEFNERKKPEDMFTSRYSLMSDIEREVNKTLKSPGNGFSF